MRIKDIKGESYLSRSNCEYQDYFDCLRRQYEVDADEAHRIEHEDWVRALVMVGLSVCFMPEYPDCLPSLMTRKLTEPAAEHMASLVTVEGRPLSAPVEALISSAESFPWP